MYKQDSVIVPEVILYLSCENADSMKIWNTNGEETGWIPYSIEYSGWELLPLPGGNENEWSETEINVVYKIQLRSYSITQLIFITDIIKNIVNKTLIDYPDLQDGEIFIRSYHTTTSLFINEHEYGNYLDLHYKFAEISKKDSSQFLHTVKALENRADFNHYDHGLASSFGTRLLILPILNKKLEIGSRENFYILVTFGPRTFQLFVKIHLIKK